MRIEYNFDLDLALKSIQCINSSLAMIASDSLIDKCFSNIEMVFDADSMAAKAARTDRKCL